MIASLLRHRIASAALLLVILAGAVGLVDRGGLGVVFGSGGINGDVDCDGDVDSVDALRVLQDVAGIFPLPDECGKPPPPGGVGLSRNNPVPAGQSLVVPEGWEISITDFISDATDLVLAENQFNEPPEPGRKYSIVRVRMTNVGADDPDNHDAGFSLRLVGSENLTYTTFTDWCGVIPDDIDFDQPSEVFRDGTVEGNLCYQVGSSESGFVLFSDYSFLNEENRRWFSVE